MILNCNLIREGVTSTSTVIDVLKFNSIQRWVISSVRGSGNDANKYQFVGWCDLADITNSDVLEEVTGGITGCVFNVINSREIEGKNSEIDLNKYEGNC